ncbi:DUF3857 domain-containing protein [Mangrovivirga sp. M17]|uniref:DUF3857 domain-containing protein n=1 Tax=Mangrovivirga halotolerans TaxID=2993936 RepID=A0ABT3RWS7_9BACT|nr:DUF3857 domain-containing protein [Mangrovivirga halotolerans]MCX2746085.1 DUF3857 domain-containing protein [Mangrovivirga halotolerans]
MKNIFTIIIFLLTGFQIIFAQEKDSRLGEVTKESWDIHNLDSIKEIHDAVIIEKIGKSIPGEYFGRVDYSVYLKVLVLNETGVKRYSSKDIIYFKRGSLNFNGITWNLKDGKLEKTEFNAEDNGYHVDYLGMLNKVIINYPNVTPGSIIEYEYKIKGLSAINVPTWEFQAKDPVLYSSFHSGILTDYITRAHYIGAHPVKVTKLGKSKAIVSHRGRKFKELTNTLYEANNVPGIVDEPYSQVLKNKLTRYTFDFVGYTDINSAYHELGGDYSKLINDYLLSDEGFTKYKSNNKFLLDYFEFSKATNLTDTLSIIKKGINNMVAYNGKDGIIPSQGFRKTIREKSGSSVDINLIFVSVLRELGFVAYPAITATRDLGYVNPYIETMGHFNYLLVYLYRGYDDFLILDAVKPELAPNAIPLKSRNENALVINDSGDEYWIDINRNSLASTMTTVEIKLNSESSITKNISKIRTDADYALFMDEIEYNIEEHKEDFRRNYSKNHINSDFESHEFIFGKEYLTENITITEDISQVHNSFYLNIFDDFQLRESPFSSNQRNSDIDFISPWSKKFMVTIEVPEGYKVKEDIESKVVLSKDKLLSCKIIENTNKQKLTYIIILNIKKHFFLKSTYAGIKSFFDQVSLELNKNIELTLVEEKRSGIGG